MKANANVKPCGRSSNSTTNDRGMCMIFITRGKLLVESYMTIAYKKAGQIPNSSPNGKNKDMKNCVV
eukprot:CAMPEP_0113848720 /NCGR_PEP_ID=MMETSP0372-20130328/2657_1 /TAXON_ID=340204 /ORGANISM="Lankesteria abbotti" /LENGTH=66 /DNA_ID=CAMNT_0000818281 /DNA_START=167 /DNA_END=367 /DNA_ORIENTATION=+ /assembly_acc=CAM_ASM_000359